MKVRDLFAAIARSTEPAPASVHLTADVVALPEPVACSGRLGLWTPPGELLHQAIRQPRAAHAQGDRPADPMVFGPEYPLLADPLSRDYDPQASRSEDDAARAVSLREGREMRAHALREGAQCEEPIY